jgi:ubiquinone/menaquinone biosynthesis C-methylase UbiE
VSFVHNDLAPPLPLESNSFDVVYAVSVLTHLSVAQQHAWLKELRRMLRPDGSLILTTHGEQSAKVLLPHEYAHFKANGFFVRSGVEEGKRCFLSYHHPSFAAKQLFAGMIHKDLSVFHNGTISRRFLWQHSRTLPPTSGVKRTWSKIFGCFNRAKLTVCETNDRERKR